jgi:hypothetical protein
MLLVLVRTIAKAVGGNGSDGQIDIHPSLVMLTNPKCCQCRSLKIHAAMYLYFLDYR